MPPISPDALRARVPLFTEARALKIVPLADAISLNNTNYKVLADGVAYLLRLGSPTAHFLGIRRDEEQAALQAAAQRGIAPTLLYAEPDGLLVMPFIEGWHWTPEEAARPENIVRLAHTLRRLHGITEVATRCTIDERIGCLLASAKELGQEPSIDPAPLWEWLAAFRAQRATDTRFPPGLCHGDFWLHNFLDDGKQLWLIDWEFTCWGDGMVDLAKIVLGGSCYTPEHQRALLDAYGYTEPDDLALLDQMKNVLLFFQAAWSLVQHGLRGSAAFDYLGNAQQTFTTLRAIDKPKQGK